jgi:hypothetical protein
MHHNLPRGEVLDVATGIALAARWFGDYLERSWARKAPDQARQVFDRLGLTGTFGGKLSNGNSWPNVAEYKVSGKGHLTGRNDSEDSHRQRR